MAARRAPWRRFVGALGLLIALPRLLWITLIEGVVKPGLPVLAWVACAVVFAIILISGQGEVLADELALRSDTFVTISSLFVGYVLTLIGGTLSQITASALAFGPAASLARAMKPKAFVIRAVWVIGVSAGMGVMLAALSPSKVVASTMSALLVLSVIVSVWLAVAVDKEGSAPARVLRFIHDHRLLFAVFSVCASLCPLLVGAMTAVHSPMSLASAGPLLLAYVGLASVGTLMTCVLYIVPVSLKLPWLGVVAISIWQLWVITRPLDVDTENRLLRDVRASIADAQRADGTCPSPIAQGSVQIRESLKPRNDPRDEPNGETRYLVSAEGGGMRAAYWTALGLAILDERTGGELSRNTVLLSAVSGGSLGIAAWVASLEASQDPRERLELLDNFLSGDLLSPLVGGLLFLDAPRAILGPFWLTTTRDEVFEKAIADWWMQSAGTNFFYRPLWEPCVKGFDLPPQLSFGATEVQEGKYAPLSTAALDTWPSWNDGPWSPISFRFEQTTLADLTIAQAVHISARFPYLSPAAVVGLELGDDPESGLLNLPPRRVSVPPESLLPALSDLFSKRLVRVGVLVDGGYFDNTGLEPVTRALNTVALMREDTYDRDAAAQALRTRFVSLHFANDTSGACLRFPEGWERNYSELTVRIVKQHAGEEQCSAEADRWEAAARPTIVQWLTAPILAMLNVREGHSRKQRDQFIRPVDRNRPIQGEKSADRALVSVEEELEARFGPPQSVFIPGPQTANSPREPLTPCDFDSSQLNVPLGWTLSAQNRAVLKCLATGAVQRLIPSPLPSN